MNSIHKPAKNLLRFIIPLKGSLVVAALLLWLAPLALDQLAKGDQGHEHAATLPPTTDPSVLWLWAIVPIGALTAYWSYRRLTAKSTTIGGIAHPSAGITHALPTIQTEATGLAGYIQKMKLFSYNARLYLLHVIGMDMIHGTWEVIFNLYLLAAGFGVDFIGLRVLIAGVSRSVAAIPMGWLSDRIGRKAGFILGDGMGAAIALLQIMTVNPMLLLVAPAVGSFFGALHQVTEPAFMAENSEKRERVHLFSVSDSLRTFSAMAGSLIAGFLPLWVAQTFNFNTLDAYRIATFIGISWWFLSLIPAVMLRTHRQNQTATPAQKLTGLSALWKNVKNPMLIAKFVVIDALIALGAGFVVPLFNVFFKEGVHAHEHEIGITFATGSAFLAIAALLSPFVVEKLGKVRTVFYTRLLSIPFIVVMAFIPNVSNELNALSVLSVVGLAYVARTMFMNMSNPAYSALSMETLAPGERATFIGFSAATAGVLTGLGGLVGSQLMNAGDFRTPFLIMSAMYLLSATFYWVFFRDLERISQSKS
jgi:MFS family permease